MFSKPQYLQLAKMQDELNILAAGPDWKEQALAWDSALLHEAAEALDHLGWEWWKKTTPNLEQAKGELIDMLHFAISGASIAGVPMEIMYDMTLEAVGNMEPAQLADIATWGADRFIKEAAVSGLVGNFAFSIVIIAQAGVGLGMSETDMFNAYIAKNVLNRFRKANGYKEGTYFKIWDGREDNEHLTEIMLTLDPSVDDYTEQLAAKLTERYTGLENKTN